MPTTNFFFNNYKQSQEQDLLEALTIEAIGVYGEDMYYIPRRINNKDKLYTEDDQSSYEQAFQVPIYIENVNGFAGDGTFLAKFGVEIRDQVIFSIAQRVFNDEVGSYTTQVRPNEGDLIYFPLNNKCFQITYVDKFAFYYQLGKLYTWKMTCELFEYSNEIFNTGIPQIDSLQQNFSTNVLNYALRDQQDNYLTTEDGDYIVTEQYNIDEIIGTGANENLEQEGDDIIDFSVTDPFSEGNI